MNRFRPRVLILPEDDANRQVANGFAVKAAAIDVLNPAGGWDKVRRRFENKYAGDMYRYPDSRMILLVDFDGRANRLEEMGTCVPRGLQERVFALGCWTTPEALRRESGMSWARIGTALAEECRTGQFDMWSHELLRHNSTELDRIPGDMRSILFP